MGYGAYTVNNISASVSAAAPKCLIQVAVPAGTAIDVLMANMGNQGTTVVSAMLAMQICTYTTSSASVTAFLPIALNQGAGASACVSGASSTGYGGGGVTVGSGSILINVAEDFNVLSGWRYEPIPERRPRVGGASTAFVALQYNTTPAATFTSDSQIQYFELI